MILWPSSVVLCTTFRSMVKAVPVMLPVKLRVSLTVTIVTWSFLMLGPEMVAVCVKVIVPLPKLLWFSWSEFAAATVAMGMRNASSISAAQIFMLFFFLGPERTILWLLCEGSGNRPLDGVSYSGISRTRDEDGL